ncbi:MAG: Ni/Fe hydrogenase subunit alpha [Chloroflexi bacterium]|nr:Ni/Fe hydrogenase subunit alpha [Chloroflexota bacterium]
MSQRIVIDPVTRIEGHAKITIQLSDGGEVEDAHLHITQIRGFEKFVEGRPFHEMPSLMARICGICPVSHLMASAKACDALMAVRVPRTGTNLRRLMNLAQIAQSHALSFFYLSAPDLLLGMDAPPIKRNLFGIAEANPQMARDGVRIRSIGQQIIEMLGGKRIHPAWVVPGGVNEPLTAEKRDKMLAMMPEGLELALRWLDWFKGIHEQFHEEIATFASFPTMFMGLVDKQGNLEMYDGYLRFVDADGKIVVDDVPPEEYATYIGEAVEPYSYLKSPYYKPLGYPGGLYRVGPLARLNLVNACGTPLANRELTQFRARANTRSSFYFHIARLIEIVYSFEKMQQLLDDPEILSKQVRAYAAPNSLEGIGVSEAPRGTLIHHYKINESGAMVHANLIIATGHNNIAMNRGVMQVARHFIKDGQVNDGILNRVEAVIRAYDPCLSCSTHAIGHMPLLIEVVDPKGAVVAEVKR